MIEAQLNDILGAAHIVLAQLGERALALEADHLPTSDVDVAILDLRFGLETAAQLPPGPAQDAVVGYLIRTYGLRAASTDPFLRPLLPPVPATGGVIRRKVRGANGRAVGANDKFIFSRAEIAPAI